MEVASLYKCLSSCERSATPTSHAVVIIKVLIRNAETRALAIARSSLATITTVSLAKDVYLDRGLAAGEDPLQNGGTTSTTDCSTAATVRRRNACAAADDSDPAGSAGGSRSTRVA